MDIVTPSGEPDARAAGAAPGRRGLALSALGVSGASAITIVLGFAFQIALAALYGTGSEMDAYLAASTIPNILTTVLFGSLSITFVPVFIEYQVRGQPDVALTVVSGFLTLSVMVLTALSLLLALFAEPIIALSTPGFAQGSATFSLTVTIFRLLLPTILLTGVASLLRSFYNAQRRFMQAAWAPALNGLLMLLSTIALAPWLGVIAVAVGTLIGAVAQLALLAPALLRSWRPRMLGDIRHPGVVRVLLLMLPWVLSAIFYKSNALVDRFLASQMDVGAISALGYANRLMTAISTVLTQGISVVLFPLMAEHVAAGDQARLREVSSRGIRLTLLLTVPVTVFLLLQSGPVVGLLFQRGQFDSGATAVTAAVLLAYLGALLSGAIGSVLTYVFYARQDTATVAVVGVIGFGVNVLGAIWLTPSLGVVGPALAYSLAGVFNLLVLAGILRLRLHGIDLGSIARGAVQIGLASACAGLIWAGAGGLIGLLPPTFIGLGLGLSTLFAAGLLVYVGACVALRVDEIALLGQQIRRRMGAARAKL